MGRSDVEKLQDEDINNKVWKELVSESLYDLDSNLDDITARLYHIEKHLSHISELTKMSQTINETYVRFETQINTFAQLRNSILEHIRDKKMAGIEAMERNNETVIACIKSSLGAIVEEGCSHNIFKRLEKVFMLLPDIQPLPLPGEENEN